MLANVNAQLCAQQWRGIINQTNTFVECLYKMSNGTWITEFTEATSLFKKICWSIGVPPLQMYNTFTVVLWAMVIIGQIATFLLVSLEMYLGCTDSLPSINIMLSCCSIIAAAKCGSYRLYAKNFINLFKSIESDYFAADDNHQRSIMKAHSLTGGIICHTVLLLAALSTLLIFSYPFFTYFIFGKLKTAEHALSVELPVPIDCTFMPTSTRTYIIFYMFEFAIIFTVCAGNIGGDCVFIILACHVCGQVKILQNGFTQLGTDGKSTRKECSVLIDRHNRLLLLAKNLISMISVPLAVQLGFTCLLICIMGFQLILALKGNDYVMIIRALVILSFFPTQLFAYSYIGDYLKCQMEEVGYAAYACSWYNFPVDIHRNVIFIMTRSHRRVQVAAGGYFPINFETYTTILKTSLSYLSVLRVVLDE